MSGFKSWWMPCLGGLLALLALPCAFAANAAVPAPLQRVELTAPPPSAELEAALAALHGQPLDAALLAQAEALVRDYYGWLEWQDLQVTLSSPPEAAGLLQIAVRGELPPPPEPAPAALAEAAYPAPATPPAVALPESYDHWLQSPARVLVVAAERRLYLKRGKDVASYTVAVGTERTPTPPGLYRVRQISHKPTWYPTRAIRRDHAARGIALPAVIPPGRGNPLGDWFVRLQDSIGIHGTDQPDSIGQASSYGCIRMRDRDLAELARALRRGDRVVVIDHDAQKALSLRE